MEGGSGHRVTKGDVSPPKTLLYVLYTCSSTQASDSTQAAAGQALADVPTVHTGTSINMTLRPCDQWSSQ